MAETFKNQVDALTGFGSTEDNALSDWLTAGARAVLNILPFNKLERIATNTSFTNSVDVEGKKMVDELFEKTEARKEEFEAKYNEIKEKVGIVKKTEEEILADLKSKVADLESKIGKVSTKAAPKAKATA